ncbi:DUF1566 domain-containing protein [Shewanella intestini]|uniref:DUF1566 domain-containing protein n=1 Tax=Shewanella intestini TaxID=2017544 RepID=A0ABS5HYV2_9GAMM|nr:MULTISPECIES: DUF1566 domain-containing protein [Shewanella]MBR9726949.1 DUF1566 domain-containing protein [Shewanella intestini]MRG34485.1 DUF1566 domain-containing protein [Shewanella sp. XMDDZSB0408]
MSIFSNTPHPLLCAFTLALLLSGCGGSDGGDNADSGNIIGGDSGNTETGGSEEDDSQETGSGEDDSQGDDNEEGESDDNGSAGDPVEESPAIFTTGMAALNDTGITFGANNDINGSNCDTGLLASDNVTKLAQDCSQGRSAQNSAQHGFDFSRINTDGSEYTGNGNYASQPWACVRDNRTGLMWEVKTTDGGIHDYRHMYRWGGLTGLDRTNPERIGDYYDDWNSLIINTNEQSLCGYSDWQVPNNAQLMSIAHFGANRRAMKIDTNYFPNTVDEFYWSAMPYRGEHGGFYAWAFQFVFANNKNVQRYQPSALRLVRAIDPITTQDIPQQTPDERYSIHDDGTVTDLATGLMWTQCVAGREGIDCASGSGQSMIWADALEYAQTSTFAQYDDWRLPNNKELFSLVDFNRVSPAINVTIFPATTNEYTWSSSPMVEFDQDSWFVNFKTGLNWFKGRSDTMLVRLVRAGIDDNQLAAVDVQQNESLIEDDGLGSVAGVMEPVDVHAQLLITEQGFTGDPTTGRNLPEIENAIAQLGKALFYTKRLSGEFDTACASCHHPMLGGGDNLSWPVGYDAVDVFHQFSPNLLGPGRHFNGSASDELAGYPVIGRNAPTIFNIGLIDRALFWDGRIESVSATKGARGTDAGIITPDSFNANTADSLVPLGASLANAQSRFPLVNHDEMRGDVPLENTHQHYRDMLAARFKGHAHWEAMFLAAYGSTNINFDLIAQALAAFEESMVFANNPWKEYVSAIKGDVSADIDALNYDQKVGAVLFMTAGDEGGAACSQCHSGDAFSDSQFHAIGLGQVGPGNGDNTLFVTNGDLGRQNVNGDVTQAYHFRTPGLLNIAQTGPYMHNGALSTLRQVMDVYGNPGGAMNDLLGIGTILNANAVFNELQNANYCQLQSVVQLMDKTGESCEQVFNNMNPDAVLNTRVLFRQSFSDTSHSPAPEIDINVKQSDNVVAFMEALTDPCVTERACLQPWIIDASNWENHPDYADNPEYILIGQDRDGNVL